MNTIYDQNFYRVAKYVNNIKKQVMIDTTEEFKPYPKNEQYLVSNKGRVYSFKRDANIFRMDIVGKIFFI